MTKPLCRLSVSSLLRPPAAAAAAVAVVVLSFERPAWDEELLVLTARTGLLGSEEVTGTEDCVVDAISNGLSENAYAMGQWILSGAPLLGAAVSLVHPH